MSYPQYPTSSSTLYSLSPSKKAKKEESPSTKALGLKNSGYLHPSVKIYLWCAMNLKCNWITPMPIAGGKGEMMGKYLPTCIISHLTSSLSWFSSHFIFALLILIPPRRILFHRSSNPTRPSPSGVYFFLRQVLSGSRSCRDKSKRAYQMQQQQLYSFACKKEGKRLESC